MTIYSLVFKVGIAAVIFTVLTHFVFKAKKNWLVSFLQNFCGALFIFSGYVKAVDPLGTSYKMVDYFGVFETVFSETWMSFIAPIFPVFANYSIFFSVFMIVFEILLGINLLFGIWNKFTAWGFFALVAFFTILTGFTYLTGYVPQGVNFFEFGKWGEYVDTNMKVTDCGCFGDYIKLKPKVTFTKDVLLMIPALIFLFKNKDMHQIVKGKLSVGIVAASLALWTLFCMNNYVWDIPKTDFRPFKIGVNIGQQKAAEIEAAESVKITHYKMTNKATGKVVQIPFEQYLKEFKSYPKEEWKLEQIKTKPAIPHSKISDFDISDVNGNDVTEEILSHKGYSIMLVAYKMKYDVEKTSLSYMDTTFVVDTVSLENGTQQLVKSVSNVSKKTKTVNKAIFEPAYANRFSQIVNPVMNKAIAAGWKVYLITGYNDPEIIDDFKAATDTKYPVYLADDILLKTIVRSNPGIVLLKDGVIKGKWHYKKMPSFEDLQKY